VTRPDTNVLVRYLALGDPVQSPPATALIERHLTEQEPGFISTVTIADTVRILDRAYRLTAGEIADALISGLGRAAGCTRTVATEPSDAAQYAGSDGSDSGLRCEVVAGL
jgi:predicted nucleic-acid-binding protein